MNASDSSLAAVVDTSQGPYRVVVGRTIISRLPAELELAGLGGRVFLISDQVLFPSAVRAVQECLEGAGIETHVMTLTGGEEAKTLDNARHIYEWLAELKAERRDAVLGLGGGVIGDLAGFAAATWLRGVPFGQIPSTLAAMVDASLGGKTAVNLPQGKNLVGSFHQPKFVLSDLDLLNGLPERELRSGWAEAIKHGLILDGGLLEDFERYPEAVQSLEGELSIDVIRRSVRIKAGVVSADERETGETRILLNYGHTIGHAIESVTDYRQFLHGEAVAIGMMAAGRLAVLLGLIDDELLSRQRAVLERYSLPVSAPGLSARAILDRARGDKKSRGGAIQWVLLDEPGHAVIRRDVPDDVVLSAVDGVVAG